MWIYKPKIKCYEADSKRGTYQWIYKPQIKLMCEEGNVFDTVLATTAQSVQS